ncbi:NAD-binding protein, partial [Burkholderia contaminans]|nr:NAD-binding protein [Burkholderia contaminans]
MVVSVEPFLHWKGANVPFFSLVTTSQSEAFERLGKEVVLVDIVDTVLNGYYDKDFTQMMAKNLEDHNIRLALGQTVKA